jgi:uncharacterized protein YegL
MKYLQKKKKLIPLGIFISLYLLVLVPLIVFNLQQRQETRSKAQTTTAATCGNVPVDVILIIDRSGSMTGDKLTAAKNAAKNFIDVMARNTNNKIGLVSFSTSANTNSQLTTNYSSVKSQVDSLSANGNTCQECGVKAANTEIAARGRAGVKKAVVMLTDGQANWIEGGTSQTDTAIAEAKAMTAVKNGFQAQGTVFFTIGLGVKDGSGNTQFFGPEFLKNVATTTGGKFYFPAPTELDAVYQDISLLIGKGLVGGFFFEDVNANGVYDTNEPKLSGWKINLTSSTTNMSSTSDSNGYYSMTGLCDGTYNLKPEIQIGYRQTLPADLNGYSITITNANSFTDKNIGVTKYVPTSTPYPTVTPTYIPTPTPTRVPTPTYKPTPTPTYKPTPTPTYIPTGTPKPTPTYVPAPTPTYVPTSYPTQGLTSFTLTAFQHGIGSSGDNSNPASSFSNKNPQHKLVDAEMQLFDVNNTMLGQGTGKITYDEQSGNYTGTITITPNQFTTGKYTLKVKTDRHLRKLMSGIQTIVAGQRNTTLPAVTLVAGDIDNSNSLNILDYNLLLDCYSDLASASNCSDPNKKTASDINDDGGVNQIDYNLFLREIATQPGE